MKPTGTSMITPAAAGLLDGVDLPADLVRTTLDQLTQAVYLYRPIFEEAKIVDLEIVYCNRAALALPLTERIIPGALASEVFLDVEVALDVAETSWAGDRPEKYLVLRDGLVDGRMRTIRYEISTGRAGDLLVQTSHDYTVDDHLEQSESRLRTIVESLDEGIVLFEPRFDAEFTMVGAERIFSNPRAERLDELIARGSESSLLSPPLDLLRAVWSSGDPLLRSIDNIDGDDPDLPTIAVDLRLARVGQLIVHVAHDHTRRRLAARAEDRALRRFDTTIEVIDEALGVFDVVTDELGNVCDFKLVYANAAMQAFVPTGGFASAFPAQDGDPVRWAVAALADPGQTHRETLTLERRAPDGSVEMVSMILGIVASEDQVVMVGADVTEMQRALSQVTASDAMLRTVLESLSESVRVINQRGEITYANAASIELLGPTPQTREDEPPAPLSYELYTPDGLPIDDADRPLQRGQRGERVDDLVLGVQRNGEPMRVCRVAVRPIVDPEQGDDPVAVVVSAHDITELTNHAERLAWISTHSSLTGMPNQRGLFDDVDQLELTASGSYNALWVRIASLATIRPTFGLEVSDEAVRSAARRLHEVADSFGGTAAHVSEHEFVVVAAGGDDVAGQLTNALQDALSEPVDALQVTLLLEPSIGIAVAPHHGGHLGQILQRSQAAAWAAERHGLTDIHWRPDLGARQRRRVELLGDVNRALEEGEMVMHYQPKFDVATRSLVGSEALVRWNRANEGVVRPDEFIPAVEASGLAGPFTLWAIRRSIAEWSTMSATYPGTSVAVNVPGPLIVDPNFARAVERELDGSAEGMRLVLEITERSVGADIESIVEAIDRFKQLGVAISIDDFGTGQSSLAYLRVLRPAEIKIDRAFVAAGGDDPVARSVLQACIEIGRAAGLAVCGEGVETEAELALLRELGCTTAQGYLLGRPAPIAALLDERRAS